MYLVSFLVTLQFDNSNVAVWRLGSKENPTFIATSDPPFPRRFNINTLETLELLRPSNPETFRNGIAHWMREPGTDNSITGLYRGSLIWGQDYFEVQRFTPNNTGNVLL